MQIVRHTRLAAGLLMGGLLLAGCTNSTTQRFNPAESALPKAAALDQDHARKLYLLVVDGMRRDGQARAALAYLNDYDRIYPNDPQASLLRADCLLSIGQADQAAPLYQALTGTGEYAAAANAGLGQVAAQRKQWPAAVAKFQTALSLDPSHAEYVNDLGYAQMQVGDYAAAVNTLGQASELDPANALMRNNLILSLHLAGRDKDARRLIQDIADPAQRRQAEHLLHVSAATLGAEQPVKVATNEPRATAPADGKTPPAKEATP